MDKLLTQIHESERGMAPLQPSAQSRKELVSKAADYLDKFVSDLYNTNAYVHDKSPLDILDRSEIFGPTEGIDSSLQLLRQTVDHVGINPASPKHLGYVPGGGIYAGGIGDLLAAVSNRYAGLYYGSPGAVKLENKLIRWACDLVGYDSASLGNITSGGSIANLIALTTARDKMGISSDKIQKSVIYYTKQTHHCVDKAVRIGGLAECPTRRITVDHLFRMNTEDLHRQIKQDIMDGLTPFYVAASTGSTDTGACDELDKIATIAQQYGAWLHIDAAYGGFFILVEELKSQFKGIEQADSIVLDPHKSLFLPYGTGMILIKDGKALFDSQHYTANYLQDAYGDGEEPSPCDLSPELTKHFRGLRMWLPFRLYGIEPFRAALKEKWLLTRYFHQNVKKIGSQNNSYKGRIEVGPEPQLTVSIFRFVPESGDANDFNSQLTELIQHDGRIFISTTNIEGIFWMRICILCFRTHLEQIDLFLKILEEKIDSMTRHN